MNSDGAQPFLILTNRFLLPLAKTSVGPEEHRLRSKSNIAIYADTLRPNITSDVKKKGRGHPFTVEIYTPT